MDSVKLMKYSELIVRNRTALTQSIYYSDGATLDSISINGGATRRIKTAGLLQIPDVRLFELVKPTLMELAKAGVVTLKNTTVSNSSNDSTDKTDSSNSSSSSKK